MKKALIFCLIIISILSSNVGWALAKDYSYSANIRIVTDAHPIGVDHSGDIELFSSDNSYEFYTYEGHKVFLKDGSDFNLGSTEGIMSFRSADFASQEGYIDTAWSGSFDYIFDQQIINSNIFTQTVNFQTPKSEIVTLRSTWTKGPCKGEFNTIPIKLNIKNCPAIDYVHLGGEQRALRAQSITVLLAQNPSYPIQQIYIDIPGANKRQLISSRDENDEYVTATLEFVTKNKKTQDYTYTITAIDCLGRSVSTSGKFSVLEDKYPNALINMNYQFFRDTNGIAKINAIAAGSYTDDPVTNSWYLTDNKGNKYQTTNTGYENTCEFYLSSPGKYQAVLTATDSWTNTYDDLVSINERKSKTYARNFIVDNTAPQISIGQSDTKTIKLGLLLLNYQGDAEALNNNLRDRKIVSTISVCETPAKDAKESFTLIDTIENFDVATFAGEIPNGLEPTLDGYFQVYNASGDKHFRITKGTRGKFNLEGIFDSFTDSGSVSLTNFAYRNPFGIELENGTVYVIFPGYSTTQPNVIKFETKADSLSKDITISLPAVNYTECYKFNDKYIFVLTNSRTKVKTAYVYQFKESYSAAINRLSEAYLSSENDLNLVIDANFEDASLEAIVQACKDVQSTGGTGEGTPASGTEFTFSYFDIENDPMYKAWYNYAGKTVEINSLSFSISPVAGYKKLQFWVMDDCGNSEFNKKSNVVTINIDSHEPEEPATLPEYKLHRKY